MYFKVTLLALSVASFATLATSSFAANAPQGKVLNDSQATLNYWTPERLKDAKPVPYPVVNPNSIKLESAPQNQEPSVGAPDAPPTLHVKPDETKLFEPETHNENVSVPQD